MYENSELQVNIGMALRSKFVALVNKESTEMSVRSKRFMLKPELKRLQSKSSLIFTAKKTLLLRLDNELVDLINGDIIPRWKRNTAAVERFISNERPITNEQ